MANYDANLLGRFRPRPKGGHLHEYDAQEGTTQAVCLRCGFAVPITALTSRVNLDAITARRRATPRLRELLAKAMGVEVGAL